MAIDHRQPTIQRRQKTHRWLLHSKATSHFAKLAFDDEDDEDDEDDDDVGSSKTSKEVDGLDDGVFNNRIPTTAGSFSSWNPFSNKQEQLQQTLKPIDVSTGVGVEMDTRRMNREADTTVDASTDSTVNGFSAGRNKTSSNPFKKIQMSVWPFVASDEEGDNDNSNKVTELSAETTNQFVDENNDSSKNSTNPITAVQNYFGGLVDNLSKLNNVTIPSITQWTAFSQGLLFWQSTNDTKIQKKNKQQQRRIRRVAQREEEWVKVFPKTRISPGEMVPVKVAGIDLLVIASNSDPNRKLYCIANSCPHLGTPLETGKLIRLPTESTNKGLLPVQQQQQQQNEQQVPRKTAIMAASSTTRMAVNNMDDEDNNEEYRINIGKGGNKFGSNNMKDSSYLLTEIQLTEMLQRDGCEDCIVCPLHRTAFALETGEVRGEWCPYPPVIGAMVGKMKQPTPAAVFDVRTRGKYVEVRINTPLLPSSTTTNDGLFLLE